jgi:hypothetical protein
MIFYLDYILDMKITIQLKRSTAFQAVIYEINYTHVFNFRVMVEISAVVLVTKSS